MDPGSHVKKWAQLARRFLGEDFWSDVGDSVLDADPKVDVYHARNEVIVLIDLPGMDDMSQVQLRTDGQHLWIKGKIPSRFDRLDVSVSERPKGEFQRSVPLGAWVTRHRASARYRRGVLEVRLPKVPAPKMEQIRVDG
ncbi:MAG: Hsp20/alpha crystallin family protein [Planifilum sp.]|jgi:HSP20 family protein